MKVLQLNIRSINTSKYLLRDYIRNNKIDIACLTETWHIDNAKSILNLTGLVPHFRNRQGETKGGGTAILLSPTIKAVRRKDLETTDLEAVFVEATINGKSTIIGSVYIPPGHAHRDKIGILNDIISSVPNSSLLITGDLNARSLSWEPQNLNRTSQNSESWRRGEMVEFLCIDHCLEILNTCTYTRIFMDDHSSPDLSLARCIKGKIKWTIDSNAHLCSDHEAIIINIDTPISASKTRWNYKSANWDQWNLTLADRLDKWVSDINLSSVNMDINNLALSFNNIIINTAREMIPTKTINRYSKPFYTPKLAQLSKEIRLARRQFRLRRDPHNHSRYKLAVETYNKEYDNERDAHWSKLCDSLTSVSDCDMWRTVNKVLKSSSASIIQPLRKSDGSYCFDDEVISERMQKAHVLRDSTGTGDFDEDWYKLIMSRIAHIREHPTSDSDLWYNRDLTPQEVTRALRAIKPSSAPGPDLITPPMIINAGYVLNQPLTTLFNAVWTSRTVPTVWKNENKIYIPKPGKDDLHVEKAYRGISLTSIVGKTMERVVKSRLYIWLEQIGALDAYQSAYRENENITQLMLNFLLDVYQGFKAHENTIAIFIDLEGAFDGVWREGVVYRLFESGLRGNLLHYIDSYLHNRMSRNIVNDYVSDWVTTGIGVPQGSVVAPLLFIAYTSELTRSLQKRISWADDIVGWVRNVDVDIAQDQMSQQMKRLMSWLHTWRLTISTNKTKIMCLTRKGSVDVNFAINNSSLDQVNSIKCLGIIVDKNLSFTLQVEQQAQKGRSALGRIRAFLAETGGASTETGVKLYKACVLPHLIYAYPAWCALTHGSLSKIEQIQYQALIAATGAMKCTSAHKLEVLCNILPLRLKLEQEVMMEMLRIFRKSTSHPLKTLIDSLRNDPNYMRPDVITPLHHMASYDRLLKKRQLSLENAEPYLTIGPDELFCHTIEVNDKLWRGLGNSSNRTSDQLQRAKDILDCTLSAADNSTLIAFTDGSALSNPGPCGAAAVLYVDGLDSDPTILSESISSRGTSYDAELHAILLVISFVINSLLESTFSTVHIFSDCQSALRSLQNNSLKDCPLVGNILKGVSRLYDHGIRVKGSWVCGHANLQPNEIADTYAKKAASKSQTDNIPPKIFPTLAKSVIKLLILDKWQSSCNNKPELTQIRQKCSTISIKSYGNRLGEVKRNRLILGHHKLKSNLKKIRLVDDDTCECGTGAETVSHIFYDCPLQNEHREQFFNDIDKIFQNYDVPFSERKVNLDILMRQYGKLQTAITKQIDWAVHKFLACPKFNI